MYTRLQELGVMNTCKSLTLTFELMSFVKNEARGSRSRRGDTVQHILFLVV